MPYIDSEEFCLGKEYHIVPLVLKKPQRNNKPPPPQPHHQTKIKKGYKSTTNLEKQLKHKLSSFLFSIECFLQTFGTRNSQARNHVPASLAKKEGCARGARTWEGTLATSPPCLCPDMLQARLLSLFLQQPSKRNSYQGRLHQLEISDIPYWHKLQKELNKVHLKFQFRIFAYKYFWGNMVSECCRMWSDAWRPVLYETTGAVEEQEEGSIFNRLMLKQSN